MKKFFSTLLVFTTLLTGAPLQAAYVIPDGSVVNSKVGFNILNYAQNAEFRFWQRQTPGTLTSRQDDQYGPDRWYYLTSGGAVNVQGARVSASITASPVQYAGQFRQADATPRQYGTAQILETARVLSLRGKSVRMGFYAYTDGTEITTLRACIGEWTGTADTVTSDVVSSWGATPTWIANFTCANTPADITISSTPAQYTVSATLGSSFNNLVLFVWTPNSEAQNDDFYMTQVQLVQGNSVLKWPLVQLDPGFELGEMQRFYQKSYNVDIAPATSTKVGASCHGGVTTGAWIYFNVDYPTTMRVTPTFSYWDMAGNATRFTFYSQAGNAQTDNGSYSTDITIGQTRTNIGVVSGGASGNVCIQSAIDAEM